VNPEGRTAVVTGGASGIGRALAHALAAAGARVVVADRDDVGAHRVAAQVGGLAVPCDVAREDDVAQLVQRAEDAFGPVSLFCANAGTATGDGLGSADEWDAALGVNVLAHVVAARLLVPRWLERGEGWFLSTASAAGLLTQIGSAPYAVSKHAAVAFAEWLSITYGDRGIGVSCLCPMGVDTPLLRDAPELGAAVVRAAGPVLSPEEVAEAALQGLRDGRFLILPHPEVADYALQRSVEHERWLAGMRRLQANLSRAPNLSGQDS
jgi:NAD(P)-dependent dehydrogenase (short-subunit alcohol dehydrogenase family)